MLVCVLVHVSVFVSVCWGGYVVVCQCESVSFSVCVGVCVGVCVVCILVHGGVCVSVC